MEYPQLMNEFAAKCGLPSPETASGAVVIDFNGIAVSFLDDPAGRAVVLHASIGEALHGREGRLARELLEANAALCEKPGAILCQDPETKRFAAIRSVPLQTADPDALAEIVAELVATVARWRERMAAADGQFAYGS